jgi:alkylation response protein AidB-like acyl-CoA dehydrogenase
MQHEANGDQGLAVTSAPGPAEIAILDPLIDRLLRECPPADTDPHSFWGTQYDLGLAWVYFPAGYGGVGLSPKSQAHIDARLAAAGSPSNVTANFMGLGMAGPTIMARGTEEQRRRFLRPAFACEEIWCQLFSEPGAGSDLAALATRAERDGDEWVINGQKVWTTLAHVADWAMILTRTDPEQPKHKGLTYFLLDMRQEGVEVRPLRQITGEAEFNEVYLTDARTSDSLRVGPIGEGWNVAVTTLMNERTAFGHLSKAPRGAGIADRLLDLYRELTASPAAVLDEVMRSWVDLELLRLTTLRAQEARERGIPGPEGAIVKLALTTKRQRSSELVVDLLRSEGMLISNYDMVQPSFMGGDPVEEGHRDPVKTFLNMRGSTIGGGTTEVNRNVLGERVLGLPPEPRVDKVLPWSQVPRS